MAKNYLQQGSTIAITNTTKDPILSGQVVLVGALAAVAITDIAPNETGDGFAAGVFLLNKKAGMALKAGQPAAVKDTIVSETGATIGVVWADAETTDETVAVKLNVHIPTVTAQG
ncbi:capsid cement protein [Xenorhabdus thuongxuanensis]|uniref:Recombinase RecA n=1 Tax=Xenorhabdus thuongxuanensis TaxID=1873484 RepID=A0A1Q5U3T0_9GAMM|nr:capsid cement protein [Xenorhabdus thuongxuanensis]OKP07124.1 hypothetical protein Xentx_01728 [Xenorhabdus thuongxuanensis]